MPLPGTRYYTSVMGKPDVSKNIRSTFDEVQKAFDEVLKEALSSIDKLEKFCGVYAYLIGWHYSMLTSDSEELRKYARSKLKDIAKVLHVYMAVCNPEVSYSVGEALLKVASVFGPALETLKRRLSSKLKGVKG